MKKIIIATLLLFMLLSQSSCEYPCGKGSSSIGLIGFNSSESDIINARRFIKSTNFSSQKDSIIIDKSHTHFQTQNDTTLILYGGQDGYELITSDFDYEIYIPGANRLFKITDIIEPMQHGHRNGGKVYCVNTFSSYKLDGELVLADKSYGIIYLKK